MPEGDLHPSDQVHSQAHRAGSSSTPANPPATNLLLRFKNNWGQSFISMTALD